MRGFKGKPFWAKYDFRWVKLRIGKQLQMRKKKWYHVWKRENYPGDHSDCIYLFEDGLIMGTKKGQVRKTARRAYEPKKMYNVKVLGSKTGAKQKLVYFDSKGRLKSTTFSMKNVRKKRWIPCRWIKSKAAIVSVPMLQVKCWNVCIRLAKLLRTRLLLQREGQSEREAPDLEGRKRGGIECRENHS